VSLAYSLAALDGKRQILAIVPTASPRRRIAGPLPGFGPPECEYFAPGYTAPEGNTTPFKNGAWVDWMRPGY